MTWDEPLVRRPPHVSDRRLAETCRHCGREPVWSGEAFCGLCRHDLHQQVRHYLSQF